ncbi:hypothetical protein EX30DRAFT_107839 [Ascodesmis nigricans]|uniref:DUF7492 domain-containing protein n=1 Tax=Ascodesmis nigricans TaxID=341454 RepID=A0A4S2MQD5_9PEZI|nr:hypothetical protein EX30DRAFT_107839 [Ascodesmis nigricans]
MKLIQLTTLAASLFASGVLSHSWAVCVDTVVPNKAELEKNPSSMSNDKETCKGYPRGLPSRPAGSVHSPDWVWESSNYLYDLDNPEVDDKGKAYACRALQRKSTTNLPITKAKPGETILIRYYGNGHSTSNPLYANPQGRDPGVVRVYWAGAPNKEIVYAEDLNEGKWVKGAQQAFEKGAIIEYKESRTGVTITKEGDPNKGQKQKEWKEWANYMAFTIPKDIQTGRHMMVWTWAWSYSHNFKGGDVGPKDGSKYNSNFKNSYSTCFDIEIEGGAKSDGWSTSSPCLHPTY